MNSINWQLAHNIGDKCNGWSNYNTWLVNLWFSEYFDSASEDGCLTDIRDSVEEHVDELIGTERSGFLGDVIGSFMNHVNWTEIESHYLPIENPHYGKRWDDDFVPDTNWERGLNAV